MNYFTILTMIDPYVGPFLKSELFLFNKVECFVISHFLQHTSTHMCIHHIHTLTQQQKLNYLRIPHFFAKLHFILKLTLSLGLPDKTNDLLFFYNYGKYSFATHLFYILETKKLSLVQMYYENMCVMKK